MFPQSSIYRSLLLLALIWGIALPSPAAIYNWQTGEVIPGTEQVRLEPYITLNGWDTSVHNLRYAAMSDLDLSNSTLTSCWFDNASFGNSNLTEVDFADSVLTDATFANSDLTHASFGNSTLTDAIFTGAVIRGIALGDATARGFTKEQLYSTLSYADKDLGDIGLRGSNLAGWDLSMQNLSAARFTGSDLTGASLRQANLAKADMNRATLAGCDMSDAIVTEAMLDSVTSRGFTKEQLYSTASYKNKYLVGIRLGNNDLSGWDLHGHNLINASLYSANLTGANLAGANIANVYFYGATLTGVDLTDAIVHGASFEGATALGFTKEQLYSTAGYKGGDLSGIRLKCCDLRGWNLGGKNLAHSDFTRANLTGASLAGCDLTGTYFTDADVTNTNFDDTVISWAYLGGASFRGFTQAQFESTVDYRSGDLSRVLFGVIDLKGWNFAGHNLTSLKLGQADCTGISFAGAVLSQTDFSEATVTNADFSYAVLHATKLVGATSRGFAREQLYSTASYKAANLAGVVLTDNDMTGWDFSNQNLSRIRMDGANLTAASMVNSSLVDAYLYRANLADLDLTACDATSANFGYTSLNNAVLSRANLTSADFYRATLTGADFTDATIKCTSFDWALGFAKEQLYSTTDYKTKDLSGIKFSQIDVSGWDFSGQNLAGTDFSYSNMIGADFTDAVVQGVSFRQYKVFSPGMVKEQLYSTASYIAKDLSGIQLVEVAVAGWDLSGQKLTDATLGVYSIKRGLEGINLSFADLRGAKVYSYGGSNVVKHNAIWTDGMIAGLHLASGEELDIRNHNMAVTVNGGWAMDKMAVLKMVLEGGWQSVVNANVTPDLGGTLELSFARGVDIGSLLGTEFQLFNWNGQLQPGDCFDTITTAPGTEWDTSRLYTDGVVILISVPEPATLALLALGGLLLPEYKRE